MLKTKNKKFELYRFQILPRDRFFQGDLFGRYQSVEELLADKNDIFGRALGSIEEIETSHTTINFKKDTWSSDKFLFRLAPKRSVVIEDSSFEPHEVETWPAILVYVDNHPDVQLVVVEQRKESFQFTNAVVNAIQKVINEKLASMNLKIFIEPLFRQENFWKIIESHVSSVREVKFELVTPNMSNLSASLSEDLKNLAKGTNADRTVVSLSTDSESNLHVDKQNPTLQGLVDYAGSGGGNISVRLRGFSRVFHTNRTTRHVEIDELEISGKSGEEVVSLLKGLLG